MSRSVSGWDIGCHGLLVGCVLVSRSVSGWGIGCHVLLVGGALGVTVC